MILKLTSGSSFKGLSLYLLNDKREAANENAEPSAERVAYTHTENLPTDDPEQAWRIMAATWRAQDELKRVAGIKATGRKCEKPVAHLSLSWAHGQNPSFDDQRAAVKSALEALGWSDLQHLMVAHKDTDHAHIHVVVNRIDPETGKARSDSNTRRILDKWANAYEKEHGQIVCPDRDEKYKAREKGLQEPERQPRTKREHWEAERAARKAQKEYDRTTLAQTRQLLWEHQKGEAAALLERTKREARAIGHVVRADMKSDWALLYSLQRKEQNAFRAAVEQRRGNNLINFVAEYRATLALGVQAQLPEGLPRADRIAQTSAALNQLTGVKAIAAALDAGQKAEREAFKAKENAAFKKAQEALWKGYREQVSAMRERQAEERRTLVAPKLELKPRDITKDGQQPINSPEVPARPQETKQQPQELTQEQKRPATQHRPQERPVSAYAALKQQERAAQKRLQDPARDPQRKTPMRTDAEFRAYNAQKAKEMIEARRAGRDPPLIRTRDRDGSD